jgi:hypothetical protein
MRIAGVEDPVTWPYGHPPHDDGLAPPEPFGADIPSTDAGNAGSAVPVARSIHTDTTVTRNPFDEPTKIPGANDEVTDVLPRAAPGSMMSHLTSGPTATGLVNTSGAATPGGPWSMGIEPSDEASLPPSLPGSTMNNPSAASSSPAASGWNISPAADDLESLVAVGLVARAKRKPGVAVACAGVLVLAGVGLVWRLGSHSAAAGQGPQVPATAVTPTPGTPTGTRTAATTAGGSTTTTGAAAAGPTGTETAHPTATATTHGTAAVPSAPDLPDSVIPKGPQTLMVLSDPPGAQVVLDGKPQAGVTPLKLENLDARRTYALWVGMKGFKQFVTSVQPSPGMQISAPLARLPRWIEVHSTPYGAQVLLDGKTQGPTPAVIRGVEEGPHRIELKLAGFEDTTRELTAGDTWEDKADHTELVVTISMVKKGDGPGPDGGGTARVSPSGSVVERAAINHATAPIRLHPVKKPAAERAKPAHKAANDGAGTETPAEDPPTHDKSDEGESESLKTPDWLKK